jgi:hypothetical protein
LTSCLRAEGGRTSLSVRIDSFLTRESVSVGMGQSRSRIYEERIQAKN